MSDFFRPLLMPAAVATIVATVWSMAYMKELDLKKARASSAEPVKELRDLTDREVPAASVEPVAAIDR